MFHARSTAPLIAVLGLSMVAALVPPVGAQAGSSGVGDTQDLVPVPAVGVGTSSWEGVVPAAGNLEAASLREPASTSQSVPIPGDNTRLHVKFRDDTSERLIASALAGLKADPLFALPGAQLAADRREAELVSGQAQPDLAKWFLVTALSADAGETIAQDLRLLPVVEMVQPEPLLAVTAPAEEERQGYLDPAKAGIDAEWAWTQPNGTGSLVTVVVIDSGFDTNHPDLDRASSPGVNIPHEPAWDPDHGMQVLGILVGDDDGAGVRGIATGAAIRTVNSGRKSGDVANAISLASAAVGAGDVISISQGICAVDGCADGVVLPLVYSSSARDALRVAAGRGVITVVSAGNGGANLDAGIHASRLGNDAPATIVVGAGNPPSTPGCTGEDGPARSRVAISNYGSRVDLQGWGACVRTTAQGGGYRWWGFTSAATPIVAGAAALLSSTVEQMLGITLTGNQVRELLRDSGSPQVTAGARGGHIGPLPDIRAAVDSVALIPSNDMFASARVVDEAPYAAVVGNAAAGVEVDEPAVGCGDISHTVWYRITPSKRVEITVDTRGSDFDTLIGLWRLRGSALERVTCNDDIGPNNDRSQLTQILSAGETYYIQVGGSGSESGSLRLAITGAEFSNVGCDINNDGYGDIVSGSPKEDIRRLRNAGRALVHFGNRKGKPTRVSSVTQEWPGVSGGSERGDRFGEAVACGDFNADGYDDLAIGSPGEDIGSKNSAGAVRVIPGGAAGLTGTRVLTITQASRGIKGRAEPGDLFGNSLAVGDFDSDGFDDLAIGVAGEDVGKRTDAGGVHVLYGSRSGLVSRGSAFFHGNSRGLPNKAEAGDALATTLAAGDFDFDGFDDLVIGVPDEGLRGQARAGMVLVLSGSKDGVTTAGSTVLHERLGDVQGSAEPGDRFGAALAVGNLNGDEFQDLVVGVPGQDVGGNGDAGVVQVFPGGPSGLVASASKALHQDTLGVRGRAEAGDAFGSALAVGDLNADGYGDLVVGVPGEAIGTRVAAGLVNVLFGSSSGVGVVGDRLVTQATRGVGGAAETGDHLGASVTTVDINGDGFRDLVVGVPKEDFGDVSNIGRMVLVPGGSGGVRTRRSSGLSQSKPAVGANERGDQFGYSLAAS